MGKTAYYHLPGLFEFTELYGAFLPLYRKHREYFYDWCEIGSLYGAPDGCVWGGGRVGGGEASAESVLAMTEEYDISARLTFSNSLLREEHLQNAECNRLCKLFAAQGRGKNGVIVHSDLLLSYLAREYPDLYFVSSTTKVLTEFDAFLREVGREEFRFAVPDFRLNPKTDRWAALPGKLKEKVEFLCNECCDFGCRDRYCCYETVSRQNLGENCPEHQCRAPGGERGYRFSAAMENPGFIGVEKIHDLFLPLGYSQFKIEGRGLGSAMVLEFLLYYLTKPEYQLKVREEIYLDAMLDLF